MSWVVPWTRYGDWLKAGEVGDEDHLINGLTCTAEIRSLAICCPACGADYEVKASDRRSPIFDRARQRFRCSRCRFAASVHVIVDVGCHVDEPKRSAADQ
jgi:rubredoxin